MASLPWLSGLHLRSRSGSSGGSRRRGCVLHLAYEGRSLAAANAQQSMRTNASLPEANLSIYCLTLHGRTSVLSLQHVRGNWLSGSGGINSRSKQRWHLHLHLHLHLHMQRHWQRHWQRHLLRCSAAPRICVAQTYPPPSIYIPMGLVRDKARAIRVAVA